MRENKLLERKRTMEQAELKKILDEHKEWLRTYGQEGRRANLSNANLRNADLRNADLRNADLRNADLDFASFPLWCGGLDVNIDDRQATQFLYHLIRNVNYSKNTTKSFKKICLIESLVKQANKFHRAEECGIIEDTGNVGGLNE